MDTISPLSILLNFFAFHLLISTKSLLFPSQLRTGYKNGIKMHQNRQNNQTIFDWNCRYRMSKAWKEGWIENRVMPKVFNGWVGAWGVVIRCTSMARPWRDGGSGAPHFSEVWSIRFAHMWSEYILVVGYSLPWTGRVLPPSAKGLLRCLEKH